MFSRTRSRQKSCRYSSIRIIDDVDVPSKRRIFRFRETLVSRFLVAGPPRIPHTRALTIRTNSIYRRTQPSAQFGVSDDPNDISFRIFTNHDDVCVDDTVCRGPTMRRRRHRRRTLLPSPVSTWKPPRNWRSAIVR